MKSFIDGSQIMEYQLNGLMKTGFHKSVGMTTEEFRKLMFPKAEELYKYGDRIEGGHIHSLMVVPSSVVPVKEQWRLLRSGEVNYSYIDIENTANRNGVKTPNKPYLIYDVDNSVMMRHTSYDEYVKWRRDRNGLTVEEAIALVRHYPDILARDRYIYITDSNCGSDGQILFIYLDKYSCPELYSMYLQSEDDKVVTASCLR